MHERDKGLDADCGIVLDRRSHPTLGPDSPQQEGPPRIVEQVRIHLRPKIRAEYPTQFSTVPVHPACWGATHAVVTRCIRTGYQIQPQQRGR